MAVSESLWTYCTYASESYGCTQHLWTVMKTWCKSAANCSVSEKVYLRWHTTMSLELPVHVYYRTKHHTVYWTVCTVHTIVNCQQSSREQCSILLAHSECHNTNAYVFLWHLYCRDNLVNLKWFVRVNEFLLCRHYK